MLVGSLLLFFLVLASLWALVVVLWKVKLKPTSSKNIKGQAD
jgi:hypothetical protein